MELPPEQEMLIRQSMASDDLLPALQANGQDDWQAQADADLVQQHMVETQPPKSIAKPLTFNDVFRDESRPAYGMASRAFAKLNEIQRRGDVETAQRLKQHLLEIAANGQQLQGRERLDAEIRFGRAIRDIDSMWDSYGSKLDSGSGTGGRKVSLQQAQELVAQGVRMKLTPDPNGDGYLMQDMTLGDTGNGITFTETTDTSGNVVRTTQIGKQGSARQDKRAQVEGAAKEYAEMKMVPALAESARAITGLMSQPQDESVLGTVGRMAKSALPFTQAGMTEDRIEAIKDMVALENLTRMRLASPTGGALGAVSDTEGRRLENMLGALKSNLSPKERIAKLRQFQRMYVEIVYGPDSRLNRAVADGKLTKEQASLARQMRDESYNKAAIGDFSFFEPQEPGQVPTGGNIQSQRMNAPTQSPTESSEYNDAMEYYRQMKALQQQR